MTTPGVVAFDSDAYDQLITRVGTVADTLGTYEVPNGLIGDQLLLPMPQEWPAAADMVTAGENFSRWLDAQVGLDAGQVHELRAALSVARSVFQQTADLASYSAQDWAQKFPVATLAPPPPRTR